MIFFSIIGNRPARNTQRETNSSKRNDFDYFESRNLKILHVKYCKCCDDVKTQQIRHHQMVTGQDSWLSFLSEYSSETFISDVRWHLRCKENTSTSNGQVDWHLLSRKIIGYWIRSSKDDNAMSCSYLKFRT